MSESDPASREANRNDVRVWICESPYARELGVVLEHLDGARARLTLPYHERLRAIGSVHGGALASLACMSAQAIARASQPEGATPPRTVSMHVLYERAARGASFLTETRLVRRARELGFFETRVSGADGEDIASATITLATCGDEPAIVGTDRAPLWTCAQQAEADAELSNTAIATLPFLARRGLRALAAGEGQLEMSMAAIAPNLDGDGSIHEGALLTLIDAAGANGPWTLPAPHRPPLEVGGATVALYAQILGRLPSHGLLARANVRAHDGRMHWCDVRVLDARDMRLHALGSVLYRVGERARPSS